MIEAACRCGARRYASEAEAHKAEPTGAFKCPTCHTFARDHSCRCDPSSDNRCFDCDTRHGSHGSPIGGPDCPEWCGHEGKCAEERAGIHAMETRAENAWLIAAEAGYPGYDYDPFDPRATDR